MGVVVWEMCCPTHTRNEVRCGVDGIVLVECVCSVAMCSLWDGLRASGGHATHATPDLIGVP